MIMLQVIMLVFFQQLIKPHEMLHAGDGRYGFTLQRLNAARDACAGPRPARRFAACPRLIMIQALTRGRRKPCTPLSASMSSEPVP